MRIPCPHCGDRPHAEFTYGGDIAFGKRPDPAAPSEDWIAFLYLRDNPRGPHREYWYHTLGCAQWVAVERDTLSHAIGGTALAGRAKRP